VPTPDTREPDPYADSLDRLRQLIQARRAEQARQRAEEARRAQQRQAAIESFEQTFPPPPSLRAVEREEWIATAKKVAEELYPERGPSPTDLDLHGIDDPTGAAFLAIRAERVAALHRTLSELIQRQSELAEEHVQ
jgi:hypothetical protein